MEDGRPLARRLAYAYDLQQGGAFLTISIIKYLKSKYQNLTDIDPRRLFFGVEKLKKQLTLVNESIFSDENFNISLNRSELQSLSHEFCDSLLRVFNSVFSKFEIDEVEVIGGSSRLPFVADLLGNHFNIRIGRTLNADETLALGAGYYGQFVRETSKFDFPHIIDLSSVYNIAVTTANGTEYVCVAESPCQMRMNVTGNISYALVTYDGSQLRPGLLTQKFAYAIYGGEIGEVQFNFSHSPFDVNSAEICDPQNGTNCSVLTLTSKLPRPTVSALLKGIEKAQLLREKIANAHNKLEQFLQQTEQILKGNETIRAFSTEEQRSEIFAEIGKAKNWLFENADNAANANNFTVINERIKKMMAMIHRRIYENATIPELIAKVVETIEIVDYSIKVDWPQKKIVVDPEFANLYRETVNWFEKMRNVMNGIKLWEDSPVRAKEFEKRGRHLYEAWMKVNGNVKLTEQIPTENSL
jgi:hypothetical protein